MELSGDTCLESGVREPAIKQERNWAVNEGTEINDKHSMVTADHGASDLVLKEEFKYDAESDNENDTEQMLSNSECDNSQLSPNSKIYINVYDDMIDIENDTKLLDVKFDIWKSLGNVESGTTDVFKVGDSQTVSREDVPLSRRLQSNKRAELNDDTECPSLKKQELMVSEQLRDNTDRSAAALHKEFSCPQCNYKTTNNKHLETHLWMHSIKTLFVCNRCDYKSTAKSTLKRHLVTHTGEKPFSCDKCNYKSTTKSTLKRHLLTHTGEKPFSCDKCDYKCTAKGTLKWHLSRHTDEKPSSCDKCDYKSWYKGSLKRHYLTHTDKKSYSCDKCNYNCNQRFNLKEHVLIHTGEKPYSCDKCDYKSSHKSNLNRHYLTHTGKKPFSCDKCN